MTPLEIADKRTQYWKKKFKAARRSQKQQHEGLVILKTRNQALSKLFQSFMSVIESQGELIKFLEK